MCGATLPVKPCHHCQRVARDARKVISTTRKSERNTKRMLFCSEHRRKAVSREVSTLMRKMHPLIRSPVVTPQSTTSCYAPTSASGVGSPG